VAQFIINNPDRVERTSDPEVLFLVTKPHHEQSTPDALGEAMGYKKGSGSRASATKSHLFKKKGGCGFRHVVKDGKKLVTNGIKKKGKWERDPIPLRFMGRLEDVEPYQYGFPWPDESEPETKAGKKRKTEE